jgi:hypothetical protein
MRGSGLFTEPGNFTNFMAILYAAYLYYSNLCLKNIDQKFTYLILTLLILSFSVFGFVFALLIVSYHFIKIDFFKKLLLILVGALFVLLFVAPYIYSRFNSGISESYTYILFVALIDLLFNRDLLEHFIGFGLFLPVQHSGVVINDFTQILYLYYTTGIFGVIAYLSLLAWFWSKAQFKLEALLFIIIACLCKLALSYIAYIFLHLILIKSNGIKTR